jgi:hypothetical protein
MTMARAKMSRRKNFSRNCGVEGGPPFNFLKTIILPKKSSIANLNCAMPDAPRSYPAPAKRACKEGLLTMTAP